MLPEPQAPAEAKRLIRAILDGGTVVRTGHMRQRMREWGIAAADTEAVLRGGVVEPAEFEHGEWRYRVRARGMYVVASFRSATVLVQVTCWRTT